MTIRAVIDPGVIVSALLTRTGASAQLLDRFRHHAFELVVSEKLLVELTEVLNRPKFVDISPADREEVLDLLRGGAIVWPDPVIGNPLTEDPEDDYLAALAEDSESDVLVTGDRALRRWTSTSVDVVSPRQLLDRVQEP